MNLNSSKILLLLLLTRWFSGNAQGEDLKWVTEQI